MIRTQIQLTDEQSRILKAMSLEKGVSIAELIRRSIDNYIQSVKQPSLDERQRRALAVVGQFTSGETDLSTAHDQYLAETYGDFGG